MEKEESLQILQGVWMGESTQYDENKVIISEETAIRQFYEFNSIKRAMEWDDSLKSWKIRDPFFMGVSWFVINSKDSVTVYFKNQLQTEPIGSELQRSK